MRLSNLRIHNAVKRCVASPGARQRLNGLKISYGTCREQLCHELRASAREFLLKLLESSRDYLCVNPVYRLPSRFDQ